jgi:hypothetical protein
MCGSFVWAEHQLTATKTANDAAITNRQIDRFVAIPNPPVRNFEGEYGELKEDGLERFGHRGDFRESFWVQQWSGKPAWAQARASDKFTLLKGEGERKITHRLFHWHNR